MMKVPQDLKENELLELAIAGDRSAGELLVTKYVKIVRAHVYNRTRDFDASNDITQKFFRSSFPCMVKSLRSKSGFKAWLFKVADRKITDYYRKFSKDMHVELDIEKLDAALLIDPGAPEDKVLNAIDVFDVLARMRKIASNQQLQLMEMFFLYDMNHSEIEDVLGITRQTVAIQIDRLIEKYRRRFSAGHEGRSASTGTRLSEASDDT